MIQENIRVFEKEKDILAAAKDSAMEKSNKQISEIRNKVNELVQIHEAILRCGNYRLFELGDW